MPLGPDSGHVVVIDDPPHTDVVRCGAELVGLSERFYRGLFVGGIVFVGMAALAALLLLPLRDAGLHGAPLTPAVMATGLLAAATPLTVWRAGALYRLLRRRPSLEFGLVLVAALLVVHPMRSQLWWPSCSILMLLAIVAPLHRALAYCLVILAANLAGHLAAGDLHETPAAGIMGLWIGYPFWSAIVAISTDRLAVHLLRLNASRAPRRRAPRHISAWTTRPRADPASTAEDAGEAAANPDAVVRSSSTGLPGDPTSAAGDDEVTTTTDAVARGGAIDRLTGRQLQVVALLADGLRYREVATCLSISIRQVQRHVAQAVARVGVRNAYELVAVAVTEGMVPTRRSGRHTGLSAQDAGGGEPVP